MNNILDVLRPEEIIKLRLRCLYEEYGYSLYKMSRFEEYRFYLENKSFLVNDSVITFTDLDGRLLALKPDVTLSIVKQYNGAKQKVYYLENVYRPDRNKRSFKEIEQLGLEYMGEVNSQVVSDVITVAAKSLYIVSENSLIELGHCGFLQGLLKHVNKGNSFNNEMLRLVSQKNFCGIKELCEKHNLPEKDTEALVALPGLCGNASEVVNNASKYCFNEEMTNALAEIEELSLSMAKAENVCGLTIDLSLVGKDDYYNGILFCGYVKGLPFRVLTGGRYDGLLRKVGKDGGAVGFALYFDTLEQLFH